MALSPLEKEPFFLSEISHKDCLKAGSRDGRIQRICSIESKYSPLENRLFLIKTKSPSICSYCPCSDCVIIFFQLIMRIVPTTGQLKCSCLFFGCIAFIPTVSFCQSTAQESPYFVDVTESHIPLDPESHALDVVLVDVNGDARLDMILALENEPNRLYLNDGDGKFSIADGGFADANHDTEHVRVMDMDNDGFVDVVFVAEDDQNHEYYLGNGDGTFQNVSDRLPAKSEANGLDVGDLDGDGLPDIIVGNTGDQPANFLWLNDPDNPGHFVDASDRLSPPEEGQTQTVKLFDADGDGDLDVVFGNESPPNRFYLNNGKGAFIWQENAWVPDGEWHTREAITFDANGDGLPDIFFANLTSNAGQKEKDPRGRLYINLGEDRFEDQTEKRIPAYEFSTYAANVIDYDGDGDLDLILSAVKIPSFEQMRVQALENDGKGVFQFVTEGVIPAVTVDRGWGIAVGDVNGDGLPDVVVGAWGGQVRLLLAKEQ